MGCRPRFPAPQKMDAMKFLAKLAKLIDDPNAKNEQGAQGGANNPQQPSINIILTSSTPVQAVQVSQNEPVTIEQAREINE